MKYQVGDIYITINPEMNTPEAVSNRFGGDWEQIQGKFLLMAGNGYIVGATGGSASVALSASNMPAHTHPFNATTTSNGSHNHGTGSSKFNYFNLLVGGKVSRKNLGSSGKGYQWTSDSTTDYDAGVGSISRIESAGAHTHSVSGTTGATGSTSAHDNMPPYLTVYGWIRIA